MKFTPAIALFFCLCLASSACSSSQEAYAPSGRAAHNEAASASMGMGRGALSSDDSGGARAQAKRSQAKVDARKLVRNAWLTLEVDEEDDIEQAVEDARSMAEAAEGYVASETTASITMMIPTEQTENFIDQLSTLGEVTERTVRVDDVTSQYVDLQIRIENLERTRKRLQELLEQSVQVSEVLEVEKELSRVTMQLEQLEGQMRTMQRDTTYARVSLQVEESVVPGPVGWLFYGGYKAVKWLFVWD